MDTVQTTTARPHIVWLDVLRLVAILMVIAIHCTDPFNASPESRANPEFNFWGSVYGSMLRASVPLFVMMTGFLLLPVRQEASAFYKKRIPRVLFLFLIYSVLFDLAPWFIQWIGGSPELVTDFFPWEPNPSASFVEALKTIALIPVTFTVYATPMWYIYVLIGLYLYMPVFSAWVEKAADKAKRMFLAFWFISLFIPYLTEFEVPLLDRTQCLCRCRIASQDYKLASLIEKRLHSLLCKTIHDFERTRTIGRTGIIAQINIIIPRHCCSDLIKNGKPPVTGVEDTNRTWY